MKKAAKRDESSRNQRRRVKESNKNKENAREGNRENATKRTQQRASLYNQVLCIRKP